MAENKIKYGLSGVEVFPITATAEDGTPTYGTKFPVPGAVNLTLDPEGEETKFFADNTVYFVVTTNNGYAGTIEIANCQICLKPKSSVGNRPEGRDRRSRWMKT